VRPTDISLTSVYEREGACRILFDLLKERVPEVNISHKAMPTWLEHVDFVNSRPYQAWYFIENEEGAVGAIYLSRQDEIGVFIFKWFQGYGYGTQAVLKLMEKHGPRRYLANIAPNNHPSQGMFYFLGFRLISHTYELNYECLPGRS
jgi:RimJ/RimL family protein N-acetyltransferase